MRWDVLCTRTICRRSGESCGLPRQTRIDSRRSWWASSKATHSRSGLRSRESRMAFITKAHLSRRTFLHGVGVTMALPLLESMIPAATLLGQTVAKPHRRCAAIYFPHAAIRPQWTPAAEGAAVELTPILQPLKPFYNQINVISDLRHANAYGSGATANHNRSAAAYLSGAFAETGAQPSLGIT